MALISPGIEVTVIDESGYAPGAVGTVPYILLATASNKTVPGGKAIAPGTLKANANKITIVNGQRDLVNLFGNPIFYQNSTGTPLHGYELNEYGLMAAYSALGVSNRAYIQRVDVDMSELIGTSVRPTGTPANGTYWLDLASTNWGIFEWNAGTQAFEKVTPIVIQSTTDLTAGVPKTSIGTIGDYAVVATNTSNPVYYKMYDNTWQLVGSQPWQVAHPVVQGTVSNPALTPAQTIVINSNNVTISSTTIASLVGDINALAIPGVTARENLGKLELFADSTAMSDGANQDGKIAISNFALGTALTEIGITAGLYARPTMQISAHTSVPHWKSGDVTSRPSGSIWVKTTAVNSGASLALSQYLTSLEAFNPVSALLFADDGAANAKLDPLGGGAAIPENSVYAQTDVLLDSTLTYKLFRRAVRGATTVTGTATNPTFTVGESFSVTVTSVGNANWSGPYSITLTGTTATSFVSDILTANIPNLTAAVTSNGSVSITHKKGGSIGLLNGSGTPLTTAGITSSTAYVRLSSNNVLIASNWVPLAYTASTTRPSSNPANGRMWYYNAVDEVDVMIHDGNNWRGYQNVTLDARGYDLSVTNPAGVIVAASKPLLQDDGTALVPGDLWLDTSDLENYPRIYRYDVSNNWNLIDTTDQTTEDGIVFADARWDSTGTTDPITGFMPSIAGLLTSDYTDLDCPDADLYPRGTLLFNTRRSSFNVKKYVVDYFNAQSFVGTLPQQTSTWVTVAGNRTDGSAYMGRKSVRRVVVAALQAGVSANEEIREEQRQFNLMVCPGYPELNDELIQLNNDRRMTAFILGDAPLRLSTSGTDIATFTGNSEASISTEGALTVADPYLGVFYPAGLTSDLSGNEIVVPATHMALRTMIRSDAVSYPWFAAAGVRRGLVDNATSLGYISTVDGEFKQIGVTESLRDTCYENALNPIAFLPGTGITVYGNKSRSGYASAMDRINVARLVVYLRRQLAEVTKPFVFEPNDKITRDEVKQSVEKIMGDLISKRAISDYLVVCDTSNNTPVRIDRNELYVDVAIVPIKAVEFIYVPIRIKHTGDLGGNN